MDAVSYRQLVQTFGTRIPEEEDRGFAREKYAQRQYALWFNALESVYQMLEARSYKYDKAFELALTYAQIFKDLKSSYIAAVLRDQTRRPPLIVNEEYLGNLCREYPLTTFVALATELYTWIQTTRIDEGHAAASINITGADNIEVARIEYLIARHDVMSPGSHKSAELIDKVEHSLDRLGASADEYKIIQEGRLSKFTEASQQTLDEAAQKWEERFEAFLQAKDEQKRIIKPVILWDNAARRHRTNFYRGIAGMAGVFIACAALAIYGLGPLMKSIGLLHQTGDKPESFTPATTLTLATLIALITAAGFILKIGGRLVTNSLTLAEDAEIRAALADTYLGLTAEEDGATTESRDKARTVMLAALFRPLPGHQQEEMVAPTVLSLAQDMLGKKTGA